MVYELEHEFIADSDTQDVIRAVCLDRVHHCLALAQVCSAVVVRLVIVAQKDIQIDLCLLDGLELWMERITIGIRTVRMTKITTRADWLQSEP
jgi:hypothetical protein